MSISSEWTQKRLSLPTIITGGLASMIDHNRTVKPCPQSWLRMGWLLLMCITPHLSFADNLYVETIGIEHGLSQNTVTAIAQDNYGFIWFGNQTSLDRFDGYRFKTYSSSGVAKGSISNGNILSLLVDSKGRLWAGTYGGLNRYNANLDQFIAFQHDSENRSSISDDAVWSLLEDRNGNIWVGTGRGLNRLTKDTDNFDRFLHSEDDIHSISHNTINALFEDSRDVLWIGTDRGLNRYDHEQMQFERTEDPTSILQNAVITSIGEDAKSRLWVGTSEFGLFVLDSSRKKITHKMHNPQKAGSISNNHITVIMKDSKERLWVGTNNGGLARLEEQSDHFIIYRHNPNDSHSLADNVIRSLYEDNAGIIWIGTYSKGISKLSPYGFGTGLVVDFPSLKNPNPHTDIRAFLVDKQDNLWVASGGNGVQLIPGSQAGNQKKILFKHNPNDRHSLSGDKIYSLFEDSSGTVWAGGENGWLNQYNPKHRNFTRIKIKSDSENTVRHGKVSAIKEDSAGALWLGLRRGGAHRLNPNTKTVTHFYHDPNNSNTISSNRVFDLEIDENDTIWFATLGGGLSQYDQTQKKFINHRHNPNNMKSLSTDHIGIVHKDAKENALWLAMDIKGLERFDIDKKTAINFNQDHGLSDNNIYAILQDNNGDLWVSHNKGLSRFDIKESKFYNYTQEDGLQSNEFNGGAGYRDNNGKLYLGGILGYNAFYVDQILYNNHVPSVYITEFQLFNQAVAINKQYNGRTLLPESILELAQLTLSYKDTVFSFEFVGLDYALPAKNKYAYKMQGLEDNWNYVDSNRRFATYTTLPPGEYTFRVKASNNNDIWNEQGASLNIKITPPFWQTWWFQSAVGLSLIFTIYLFYALRVRSIRERNKFLREEVRQRTKELLKEKDNLEKTLIELGETKDALIEAAHKAGMADTATGVLHNVGNLLNSVNTSTGIIHETINNSITQKIHQANELLKAHEGDLTGFMTQNKKGPMLLQYIIGLDKPLKSENLTLRENVVRLQEKIIAIREAIAAQQRYAQGAGAFNELLSLEALVEESLKLQSGSIDRHEITLEKRYDENIPMVKVQKIKLVQILVNLYKNAKESMDRAKSSKNILTIEIKKDKKNAYIIYADTGLGIAPDQLQSIFAYGYTTKENGHGFGLHSCANFMTEMGGKMWAESDGLGHGAKFIVSFPLH